MLFTKRIKNYISLYFVMIISLNGLFCAQQVDLVFEEVDGLVAVEAEHFFDQEKSEIRKWYIQKKLQDEPGMADADSNHAATASCGAYLAILPDTRSTHDDKLITGENFTNKPGEIGILNYKVNFNKPGKYYVWVRAFSTGTEDNGLHVGMDGQWPESGQRLQWCEGKNQWTWESKQRTEEAHCGEPEKIYLNVENPGIHTISFSMREDGFEFDKWVMSLSYTKPVDFGPEEWNH